MGDLIAYPATGISSFGKGVQTSETLKRKMAYYGIKGVWKGGRQGETGKGQTEEVTEGGGRRDGEGGTERRMEGTKWREGSVMEWMDGWMVEMMTGSQAKGRS